MRATCDLDRVRISHRRRRRRRPNTPSWCGGRRTCRLLSWLAHVLAKIARNKVDFVGTLARKKRNIRTNFITNDARFKGCQ